MLVFLPFFASFALAAVVQIRQSAEEMNQTITQHASSATADLSTPGYASLIWPVARGYSKLTHREFCGGQPSSQMRNEFPLTGGKVSMLQQKDVTNVRLSYSILTDPTSLNDFVPLADNLTSLGVGWSCTEAPDFAAQGLTAGQNMTISLEYVYGSHQFSYFSCSDVILVPTSEWQKSIVCIDAMIPQETALLMTNGSSNAVFAALESSSSGLSAAAGGGIGASVTLVVLGALFAALLALGIISLGRKQNKASHRLAHNDSGSSLVAEKAV